MLKGYITNLGKYNEGYLVGKWIEFPINEEDLSAVFEEIGINEEYEEYFFTDWDCDFSHTFGEYESILKINEISEKLEEWDEDTFKAACEIWDVNEVLENDPSDYTLYYDVNNDYDLGYYWVHDSGCYDLKNMGTLANYIDYEAFGRDIRFESNGGYTILGWVELVG